MDVCFRAMIGRGRSPRDRVAVEGVVFVDENINLPALKHIPVKTPFPAIPAV